MRTQAFVTAIVGLDPLVRKGLVQILRPAGFRIAASIASIDENVFIAFPQDQPLLLVLDLGHNPGAAIEQIQRAKQGCSAGRVAVLAPYYEHADIISAFRAGANCYLVRTMAGEALIKSLELVMLGETILPSSLLSSITASAELQGRELAEIAAPSVTADDDDAPRLSVREERILRYLVQGDSNKVIARSINISEATVKVHVKAILRKIRAHNRTQAAIWAIHKGLATRPDRDPQLPLLSRAMPTAPDLPTRESGSNIALQANADGTLKVSGINGAIYKGRS